VTFRFSTQEENLSENALKLSAKKRENLMSKVLHSIARIVRENCEHKTF
jgi:hypothetical protein